MVLPNSGDTTTTGNTQQHSRIAGSTPALPGSNANQAGDGTARQTDNYPHPPLLFILLLENISSPPMTCAANTACKLVEHVSSEYRSRKRKLNWEKVSEYFGVSPLACLNMHYRSRNNYVKKEDAEVAKNDGKDSKLMVKAMLASAKKRAYSRATWTADDVARLREPRGDRNKKCDWESWARIAEYVGAGKTAKQCQLKWVKLCLADDLKALGNKQSNTTATNGATSAKISYHSGWTPDEISQLKALLNTPSDPKNPRLHIAYAMFPQKPRAQVCYTLDSLRVILAIQRRNTKELEVRPLLRKLVSDSGGAENADWEAISKEFGLTAYRCQKIYYGMTVAKSSEKHWMSDEFDRLLKNLRSQHIHGGSYDWNLAAAAVGTRTSRHCYDRFYIDQRSSRRSHLYDFGSLQ